MIEKIGKFKEILLIPEISMKALQVFNVYASFNLLFQSVKRATEDLSKVLIPRLFNVRSNSEVQLIPFC